MRLLQLIGLALIVIGALLQTEIGEYAAFYGGNDTIGIFIIVIGIVCVAVGFFGCCGAYKENHFLLITVRAPV